MAPTLPAAVPRRGGPIMRAAGRITLRLLGWRVEGEIPDRPKFVIIAAPHTSNWDFVVAIAAKFSLGLDVKWLGKHTLFRGPWGALLRSWGGIPVDRRSSNDTVAAVIDRFAASERLIVGLAPQGTRKSGGRWKTGFWHIAHGAQIPIMPIAFDWERRAVQIFPAVETREVESDLLDIQALYTAFRGRQT